MTNDAGNTVLPLDSDGVQPGFDIVLRGYDRGQVDRQVSWLEEQLGAADRDLQAVTETLRRTEQDATAARRQAEKAAAELARGKPTFEALGERVTAILSLAEEEADVLRQGGREEAEETRQELLAEHAAARDAAQQERRTAQQQSEAILAQAQQEAQRVISDARRHAAETTGAAQRQVEAMTRQRDASRAGPGAGTLRGGHERHRRSRRGRGERGGRRSDRRFLRHARPAHGADPGVGQRVAGQPSRSRKLSRAVLNDSGASTAVR